MADTPDADTPPTPFQAHLRSKSDNRRQTERKRACSICRGAKEEKQSLKEPSSPAPNPPTQKRLADKPQAPFALPTAQPTLEARAELSLLELCLARRRKTTVKKRADAVQHQPSSVFWISQFVTSNFYLAPSITFRPASDSRYFCVGLLGESGCVIST